MAGTSPLLPKPNNSNLLTFPLLLVKKIVPISGTFDLNGLIARIRAAVDAIGAKRVVIDSFSVMVEQLGISPSARSAFASDEACRNGDRALALGFEESADQPFRNAAAWAATCIPGKGKDSCACRAHIPKQWALQIISVG